MYNIPFRHTYGVNFFYIMTPKDYIKRNKGSCNILLSIDLRLVKLNNLCLYHFNNSLVMELPTFACCPEHLIFPSLSIDNSPISVPIMIVSPGIRNFSVFLMRIYFLELIHSLHWFDGTDLIILVTGVLKFLNGS